MLVWIVIPATVTKVGGGWVYLRRRYYAIFGMLWEENSSSPLSAPLLFSLPSNTYNDYKYIHQTAWGSGHPGFGSTNTVLGPARSGRAHHIFKKFAPARPGPSRFSDRSGPARPRNGRWQALIFSSFFFQILECEAFQMFCPLLNFQTLERFLFLLLFLFFGKKKIKSRKKSSIRTALHCC